MFLRIFLTLLLVLWWVAGVQGARLNLYLNIINPVSTEKFLKIKRLYLLGENQELVFDINQKFSSLATFGQYFLASRKIPPGKYQGLIVELDARKRQKLSVDFFLRRPESLCLFIFWDVKGSVGRKGPILSARLQRRPLGEDTIYVTCEDLDTVFAIRTDLNQVQASLGIEGKPQGLALSEDGKLYVVAARNKSVYLVETASFSVTDRLLLPLVSSPKYLVLLPDKKAVISDPQTQYVILIDLGSGQLLASQRLGHRPLELFYYLPEDLIFVSSPLDQAVYVLNANLSLNRKLSVQSPRGLLVVDSVLYVAEYQPGMVGIYDFRTGYLKNIRSGQGTVHLTAVERRIFVSNEKEGSLTILRAGQLSISKKIRLGGHPFTLSPCPRRRWLYVANRTKKSLMVIDLTSEKLVGEVKLGGTPFGLSTPLSSSYSMP